MGKGKGEMDFFRPAKPRWGTSERGPDLEFHEVSTEEKKTDKLGRKVGRVGRQVQR